MGIRERLARFFKEADQGLRLKIEVRHFPPRGHRMLLWKATTNT
jgi:hypothetical protein